MTFEPRHENKSCSACPEDQLKLFKISNFSNFQKFSNFQIFSGSQLLSDFQTFLAGNQLYELMSHRRGWCGGSKKHIAIFAKNSDFWAYTWKQNLFSMSRVTECESERVCESESVRVWEWLLSIEMKTKVVQHVKSDSMRDWVWEWERVRQWESERKWEWEWE